jgi:hypothetical protein
MMKTKFIRAQTRDECKVKAEKAKKKRPTPYSIPAATSTASNPNNNTTPKSSQKHGVSYNCFKPGHWQYECPEKRRTKLRTIVFIEL